jgi:hypothetical protein
MTVTLVLPVLFVASCTVPINVWVPFGTGVDPTGFVAYGIVTGPCEDVVWLPICNTARDVLDSSVAPYVESRLSLRGAFPGHRDLTHKTGVMPNRGT